MGRSAATALVAITLSALFIAPAEGQTRTQWATAADAICKREFAKVHAAVSDASRNPPTTIRQWTRFVDRMTAPMKRVRRDIGALERPTRDRAAIASVLSLMDRTLAELKLARAATIARNLSAYRTHLKRAITYGGRADEVFRRLGAWTCADG